MAEKITQRKFEACFTKPSICVGSMDCPLSSILGRLNSSEEGFLEMAQVREEGLFTNVEYTIDEKGEFRVGEITVSCSHNISKYPTVECGEFSFKITAPESVATLR